MPTKWFGWGVAVAAAALVFTVQLGPVQAVDADSSIDYRGGAQGRVIFDGRTHAAAGLVCTACHTALFPMQRTGLINMADHTSGQKCFGCHNGTQVFNTCTSCHRGVPNN
jgi:c(7)-type cytochrome triheme protein